jgi:hypothetical protein
MILYPETNLGKCFSFSELAVKNYTFITYFSFETWANNSEITPE